jgi:hypothetical protein
MYFRRVKGGIRTVRTRPSYARKSDIPQNSRSYLHFNDAEDEELEESHACERREERLHGEAQVDVR